jgi:TolB-like protein/tRNA A-37 threonylcarbamoyl transferase component Bud32
VEPNRLGHYIIEGRIGEGGMGVVHRATDEVLGRTVAIKVLQQGMLADTSARARFLREARAIAALNHPAIASIYEAGEADGCPFLVMEYLSGPTLHHELIPGPLPPARLLPYARQLASALQHSHARGVLHRDIKSSNVVVVSEQQVKLLDFGLALLQPGADSPSRDTQITAEGTFVGSLPYTAPEILTGSAASVRTDIYSLGIVMYEMACGQTPFAALPFSAVAGAILQGRCEPVSARNPTIPPDIAATIQRAIAVRPQDRFATADEILHALETSHHVTTDSSASDLVLAIVEFQNLSAETAMDWLGTGIAETLISDLKNVREIKLIMPDRVRAGLRAAGGQPDFIALGRQLGAGWVVSGSYQRGGPRLRITTRITEIATGNILSTAKIDGNYDDIFELQDRVAHEVVSAFRLRIDAGTLERIVAPETRHLQAYEAYAQARASFNQLGKSSLEHARQLFERALELDSDYAMAHSGIGATYCMRYIHRTDPDDLVKALGHLERARELDHELGEPYPWLCYAYMRRHNLASAIQAGRRGCELQPDLVTAHYFLGAAYILSSQLHPEHYQAALDALDAAIHTEPNWIPSWLLIGEIALLNGRYDVAEQCAREVQERLRLGRFISPFPGAESLLANVHLRRCAWSPAIEQAHRALEALAHTDHMYREPLIALTCCTSGDAYLRLLQPQLALAEYHRAWHMVNEYPRMLGRERVRLRTVCGLASAYAAADKLDLAQESLAQIESLLATVRERPGNWVFDSAISQLLNHAAVAHLRCAMLEQALTLLEHSVDVGWRDTHWLAHDPELQPLHDHPRYLALRAKLETFSSVSICIPDELRVIGNTPSATQPTHGGFATPHEQLVIRAHAESNGESPQPKS